MIEVKNLTKRYGDLTAVSSLNFTVESGKIYGFLGPNGAGKSTTMNIITGCLAATEGTVTIDGHDIFEEPEEAKKCVGYLPEQPPLYPDMTPKEYLKFVGQAKGVGRSELKAQIDYAMKKTGIEQIQNRLIRNLSKGYKQRVGIAQALLGKPGVIILDEPTVGLDPKQVIEIRNLIRELGQEHTVILSSHILSEVNSVCDHIIIISEGKLVASEEKETLVSRTAGTQTLKYTVRGKRSEVAHALENIHVEMEITPSREEDCVDVVVTVENNHQDEKAFSRLRDRISFALMDARLLVVSMDQSSAGLEDVFLELTGGEKEDALNL